MEQVRIGAEDGDIPSDTTDRGISRLRSPQTQSKKKLMECGERESLRRASDQVYFITSSIDVSPS